MMAVDEKDFDRVYHAVFGNGSPGIDELVRVNTRAIETMKADLLTSRRELRDDVNAVSKQVMALAQERRDDNKKREGRVELYGWARTLLIITSIIVGILVPLGFLKISSQNQHVIQQLRNLPPLPE